MMKTHDLQPEIFYPATLSFRVEGQIKSFPDKNKLKEFINSKPGNVGGTSLRRKNM